MLRFDADACPRLRTSEPSRRASLASCRASPALRSRHPRAVLAIARPLAPPQQLHLAPAEIDKLRAVPGDEVKVSSPSGELTCALVADAGVPSGVALLQFNAAPIYEQSASALIANGAAAVEIQVEKVS